MSILSIAWLLFLLEPLSSTGLPFPWFSLTFGGTVLLGVISLALGLTRRPLNSIVLLVWLVYPLAACSLVLLFLKDQSPANPLFRVRFQLSKPALEDAIVRASPRKPLVTPTWAGLFPVRRIDVSESEVRLISDGCGVVDECGFLYRLGPLPEGRAKTKVKHLSGPWYHLYAVF